MGDESWKSGLSGYQLTKVTDLEGQLTRTSYTLTLLAPDLPAVLGNVYWGLYNLQSGGYFLNSAANGLPKQVAFVPRRPDSFFSPDELANLGAR